MTYPIPMRKLLAVVAALLIPLALIAACSHSESERIGLVPSPVSTAHPFLYTSGNDGGTVVVPGDQFVTSIWASGGSYTITPVNPYTDPACDAGSTCTANDAGRDGGDAGSTCLVNACVSAGTAITVPAAGMVLGSPPLVAGRRGLADGTVITFAAGTSYAVTLQKYGQ